MLNLFIVVHMTLSKEFLFSFSNSTEVIGLYVILWVYEFSINVLCQIFSPYGLVEDIYIMRDELKQSRGAFLIYPVMSFISNGEI